MGKCRDCKSWTRDTTRGTELDSEDPEDTTPFDRGYGRCLAARHGAPMMPKYDGGYTGELLTRPDFGCTEFEAN